jgi:undecaprenyl-diphosphatase
LIFGTSRSGITLTVGLMLGLTRQAAARFSFLLSIPVIVLAGGWQAVEVVRGASAIPWSGMIVGALVSGVVAYWTIHFFIQLLDRIGMMPFVVYRLLLGILLLALFY